MALLLLKMTIDDTDKKILFELDRGARRSVKDIAKKLGLKRDTVAYRIKQLEKNEVINGYYTIIDYSKLGYVLARLYIKLQKTTPQLEEEAINHLMKEKSSLTIYQTEGTYDIAAGFLVKKIEDFKKVLLRFQEKYQKYVNHYETAIFYEFRHYFKNYLVEPKLRNYGFFSIGKSDEVKLDDTDKKILWMIARDAKKSLLDMANELEMTSMAVRYRIKQMEKSKVILGYRALINLTKCSYEYYKLDLTLDEVTNLKGLQEFCLQHPNVTYEDRAVSSSDFEVDLEMQSNDDFYKLINVLKTSFPGVIRTYRYYRARKIYKFEYFPLPGDTENKDIK